MGEGSLPHFKKVAGGGHRPPPADGQGRNRESKQKRKPKNLWNVAVACGMLQELVECSGSLWNVAVACEMLRQLIGVDFFAL